MVVYVLFVWVSTFLSKQLYFVNFSHQMSTNTSSYWYKKNYLEILWTEVIFILRQVFIWFNQKFLHFFIYIPILIKMTILHWILYVTLQTWEIIHRGVELSKVIAPSSSSLGERSSDCGSRAYSLHLQVLKFGNWAQAWSMVSHLHY